METMNGQDTAVPCSHGDYSLMRGDKPANKSISGSGKCCEGNQAGGRDERVL